MPEPLIVPQNLMTGNSANVNSPSSPQQQSTKKKRYTFKGVLALLAFAGLLVYGLLIGVLRSSFFDSVVLQPLPPTQDAYKSPVTDSGVEGQTHFFKTPDGLTLHAWYFAKPGAKKVVVYHHGNAGNIAHRLCAADCVLKSGANVFLYDYRGYGKSEGQPRINELRLDGLAAYDYVNKQLATDPTNIINYGESIGSGVACQIASERPAGGLILQSAIGSLPMMGHKHMNTLCGVPLLVLVPDFLFPDPKLNNIEQITKVHVPLLLVHGQKDCLAPYHHSELIYEAASEPKKLVGLPNCGHNDIGHDSGQFIVAMSQFLSPDSEPSAVAKNHDPGKNTGPHQ